MLIFIILTVKNNIDNKMNFNMYRHQVFIAIQIEFSTIFYNNKSLHVS